MPRKKKRKTFSATKAVKAKARAVIGAVPPVRREETTKREKPPKHKKPLGRLLAEQE